MKSGKFRFQISKWPPLPTPLSNIWDGSVGVVLQHFLQGHFQCLVHRYHFGAQLIIYLVQLHVILREHGNVQPFGNGFGNRFVLLGLSFADYLAGGQAQTTIFITGGPKTEQSADETPVRIAATMALTGNGKGVEQKTIWVRVAVQHIQSGFRLTGQK